ncbi:MAG: hypothetical protein RL026_906 [Pseudomonadota bacterium]
MNDEHHAALDRRRLLGGLAVAAAGTAGAFAGLLPAQAAAQANATAAADAGYGPSQAPTITDVKDKVAYITGASSGIGLGIARVLHEAGAKVVLGYIDDAQIAEALKFFPAGDARVHAIKHDVMDAAGWIRTADEIERRFGGTHILINNAGVGLQAPASTGTLKDWEWGLGVNLWGPIHGVHTFVPRMLASGQGCQIVTTTSTSGILPGSGAGIYTVAKIAAVGLMEELRHELRNTNIGTTAFIPGLTTTNIGQSENYRPEALRNEGPAAVAPGARPRAAAGAAPPASRPPPPPPTTPAWTRPQDPLVVGRFVLDGILNNDLFVVLQPEYRMGVEARCNALLESMVPFTPMPAHMQGRNYDRTPIFVQEIAHRRATRQRNIPGT